MACLSIVQRLCNYVCRFPRKTANSVKLDRGCALSGMAHSSTIDISSHSFNCDNAFLNLKNKINYHSGFDPIADRDASSKEVSSKRTVSGSVFTWK